MDWSTYKAIAARPDVLPRELIRWTVSMIADPRLRRLLTDHLSGEPCKKPEGASDDPRIDLFPVTLRAADAEAVIAAVGQGGDLATGRVRHAKIVWCEYLEFRQREELEMQAKETVDRLMAAFDRRDIDGIAGCFAANAVYHNIPMEAVQGVDAIKASLAPFIGMASEVRFEVLRSVASGNVVMNERIDRFNLGGKWLSIAVMGVFEVGPEGITAWRDYFDLGQFQSQMAAIQGG